MSSSNYDVLVAGGSVAGLLTARELASRGISVVVVEEHHEIGTPEHCGGMVSAQGLNKLGIMPDSNVFQNFVTKTIITSPSSRVELNSENQNVIVIDRRALDKQIAHQAQRAGAAIRTRCTFKSIGSDGTKKFIAKTTDGDISCRYFVDARGIASLASSGRENFLPSAQFEIYASWIKDDIVQVTFDSDLYPGFFAWIIPTGQGIGKVGVAGRGINVSTALKDFVEARGERYSTIRKIFAPIWIGGAIDSFVTGKTILVGDAAGQTKPSTAGGIYSCGIAGILAGRAIAETINLNEDSALKVYEQEWRNLFQNEFRKMTMARKVLERLDNKALDEIINSLTEHKLREIIESTDFDYHSNVLSLILGSGVGVKLTRTLLGNEFRKIFS
ncbi:MAG: NAD(P)/FAD-dependent oxidoreductase [Nitrososphaerota archaeon]